MVGYAWIPAATLAKSRRLRRAAGWGALGRRGPSLCMARARAFEVDLQHGSAGIAIPWTQLRESVSPPSHHVLRHVKLDEDVRALLARGIQQCDLRALHQADGSRPTSRPPRKLLRLFVGQSDGWGDAYLGSQRPVRMSLSGYNHHHFGITPLAPICAV